MSLPPAAVTHYRESQALTASVMRRLRSLWALMGDDFDLSWATIQARVAEVVAQGQAYAVMTSTEYASVVSEQVGMPAELAGPVNVAAFAGVTGGGEPVAAVARDAVIHAKVAVAGGVGVREALRAGGAWLEKFARNEITAARSDALSAFVAASPTTTGFVRMLNPPSCRNCLVLAGKWFRWNEGFQRHNGCDCTHVPARESAQEYRTDPYAYFRGMSPAEQDRMFGKEGAQAIRDGADIYRVVNVKQRGASERRGWAGRLYKSPTVTIEDILKQSRGDRTRALELMRVHGFILPQGQVAGGALAGNAGGSPWGYSAGAMGRGGSRKGATAAYRQAVESGNRDILNPATQTAAERRFHQAYLRAEAMRAGRNPFSGSRPMTALERQVVERDWESQLKYVRSRNASGQVKAVADRLGVK